MGREYDFSAHISSLSTGSTLDSTCRRGNEGRQDQPGQRLPVAAQTWPGRGKPNVCGQLPWHAGGREISVF